MKRFIYVSLFCITHAISSMDALWIDEEDPITVSPFTQSVHQRYYFLARLEAVHALIESLHCSCIATYYDYQALSQLQPQHPRIIRCINEMQQDQTCEPLFRVWDELCSYKYIQDEQLIKEYITLICIIAHQLITLLGEKLSPEEKKTLVALFNRSPSTSLIHSHDVAYRYYIVKRLKKVNKLIASCAHIPIEHAIMIHLPSYMHPRIMQCAQEIESSGHLKPLVQLCKDLEQFQSVDDVTFIHELLTLIVLIEQHALAPHYLPRQKESYIHFERDLDDLSVEELLKSIDILTAHIEPYALTKTQSVSIPSCIHAIVTCVSAGILAWYAYQTRGVHT